MYQGNLKQMIDSQVVSEDWALRNSEKMKTTKGGKKNDQQQEPIDGGTGSSADQGAMAGSCPGDKIVELSGLVKALMQSQTDIERK